MDWRSPGGIPFNAGFAPGTLRRCIIYFTIPIALGFGIYNITNKFTPGMEEEVVCYSYIFILLLYPILFTPPFFVVFGLALMLHRKWYVFLSFSKLAVLTSLSYPYPILILSSLFKNILE
jgi:hypothetical protein